MSRQRPTNRAAGWIEILTGVETTLEKTLAQAAQREQAVSARPDSTESDYFAHLAKSSERWSGLWRRSADGGKEFANAESALANSEQALRKHLDALVACRQNLAHWLDRAVG